MVEELEQDTLETAENSELEPTEEPAEEVIDENEELKKAQELANNYKIRAEKAEALAKQLKKPKEESSTPKTDELSSKDLYACMKANVPQEDLDEVIKAAKVLGVSVAESLNTAVVKAVLNTKAEERRTAQATNTGGGRKGAIAPSSDEIVSKALSGKLPAENDDDGIKRLSEARLQQKLEQAGLK